MTETFSSLGIDEKLVVMLGERGIVNPTPVQADVIPAIIAGRDVVAESPTGTGKTLAYLLPLTKHLDKAVKNPQILILAPTHELVMQITRESERVFDLLGYGVVSLIGGVDPKRQLEKLKKNPAIVVGTPGRVNELAGQRKLKLHEIKTIVIDEADRLLDQGFSVSVEELLKRTMRDTQRLFFSATLSQSVRQKLAGWVREALIVNAQPPVSQGSVEHYYLLSDTRKKVDTLRRLLRMLEVSTSIVFVNEIDKVSELEAKLHYHHLPCRLLHSDTPKLERAKTLADFREGKFPVLISTDVASRGLDIAEVEVVVHFDPATDSDAYLHRSGRTGRMGRSGKVFSIITPEQKFIINKFSQQTGLSISERMMSHGQLIERSESKLLHRGNREQNSRSKSPSSMQKPGTRSNAGKKTTSSTKKSAHNRKGK